MASLSRPAPNGDFIKGFSQFVKASSNQKGRPPRSGLRRPNRLLRRTSSLSTAGRPTVLMEAGPDSYFINANRFLKAQWPLYQAAASPNGRFIFAGRGVDLQFRV